MKKITKHALTLSAAVLLVGTSMASALADYKPNRKDTGPTREQIEEMGFTGILPLDRTGFTVFQRPNSPANELVFYVISRVPLEGCFETMPFELEQKIEGKSLTVDLKFPIVRLDNTPGCEKKRSMETAEMILDLDELRDKEINVVRLMSKYSTRVFDLELTDNMFKLIPRESVMSQGIEYWIPPKNTVMLSVPMAKTDLYYKDDILQELAMVAENNGLEPIENKISDFMPQKSQYNRFYFLDTEGKIRDALSDTSKTITIGKVHRTEPFYGPNGKYDKKIPMDVIATLPQDLD